MSGPSNDPVLVKKQYSTEANLRARQALYEEREGENPPDVLWRKLREWRPRTVLEVGGGEGELSQRMQDELGAKVTFLDQSERMVEIARARGLDARLGDVQELPFRDASFDMVVAAWMLYHVQDIDRALGEIARVLQPGGSLVAVTNSLRHLAELRELIGPIQPNFDKQFHSENGEELLGRHFSAIERIDTEVKVTVRDRAKLVAYQQSLSTPVRPVPDDVQLPFIVHGRCAIFRATK
jgi:SAM-dependent methyltransferase